MVCAIQEITGATLTDSVRNHTKMVPLIGDPSLYVKQVDG